MLGRKHCETQIEVELLFPFQLTWRQSNARGQPPSQGGKDGGSKVSLFGEKRTFPGSDGMAECRGFGAEKMTGSGTWQLSGGDSRIFCSPPSGDIRNVGLLLNRFAVSRLHAAVVASTL